MQRARSLVANIVLWGACAIAVTLAGSPLFLAITVMTRGAP
jgi:hypothetical protein